MKVIWIFLVASWVEMTKLLKLRLFLFFLSLIGHWTFKAFHFKKDMVIVVAEGFTRHQDRLS